MAPAISPGGALLRASRMFAIPAPLQRPASEMASVVTFNSNTATLPHPIELSISTPPSSRSKGDWGFKRNLPLRSTTKSSTPIIRVSSIDTQEHITEFASAADHALTHRKWQELNMPLTTPAQSKRGHHESLVKAPGRGVFEEDTDFTNVQSAGAHNASKDMRWKFQGPWLAGQTEGEFNYYVAKDIAAKRPAFRNYIHAYKAEQDTKAAQRKALDAGEETPVPVKASDITEEEMTQYIRALRQDRTELFRLIRDFLDLPPAPSFNDTIEEVADQIFKAASNGVTKIRASDYNQESNSPYANTGPPKTHPSAGLSYLRSNAYISNHPIYGPQAEPTPVEGRVIMPKNAAVGSFAPKLGVAGVVTDVPTSSDFYTSSSHSNRRGGRFSADKVPGLINIEPEKVGGSKVMLKPRMASIDPKGRIILSVDNARPAAVQVAQGTVAAAVTQTPVDIAMNETRQNRSRTGAVGGYGLGAGRLAQRPNPWASTQKPKTAGAEYKQLESLLGDLPKKN